MEVSELGGALALAPPVAARSRATVAREARGAVALAPPVAAHARATQVSETSGAKAEALPAASASQRPWSKSGPSLLAPSNQTEGEATESKRPRGIVFSLGRREALPRVPSAPRDGQSNEPEQGGYAPGHAGARPAIASCGSQSAR